MIDSELCSVVRVRVLEFLILSAQQLEAPPIVKYAALSIFSDRFYRALPGFKQSNAMEHWLLQPIRESNLQLFALSSIWISSKMHESHPLSVRKLKHLGDKIIQEQHFTTRDFVEAEVIVMQVLNFEVGTSNIAFNFLEQLLMQLKGVAKVGEHINFEACMDIMDLLYEEEETSILYSSPCSLAASILVASYVITVPKQKWEFPLLPWGHDLDMDVLCKEFSPHLLTMVYDQFGVRGAHTMSGSGSMILYHIKELEL